MDDVAVFAGPMEEGRPTIDKRTVVLLTTWRSFLLWTLEDPMYMKGFEQWAFGPS